MVILELVGQGIKGLPPALRTSLKPGYTLFQAPQGNVSLWPILDALCFPDPRSGGHAFLANPGVSLARLGLTFLGRDGITYRLVREIGGSGTLAKMDPGSGKFVGITKNADEIAQYLRSSLGVPTRGAYENVFTLSRGQFPSVQPAKTVKVAAAAAAPKLAPSRASAYGVEPVPDIDAAQKQIKALEEELGQVKELEDLQFRLDGAQRRIFESGSRVKSGTKLEAELAAARADMEAAPSLEALGLPPNVGERAARMEVMEKNRDEALSKLDAEREQFLGSQHTLLPLYRDPVFLGSTAAGIASVGGAFVLGHAWRYLALVDMPAFGVAAIWALRWVTDLQANEGVSRRKIHYDEKERTIREGFENEVLSVRTAMKLLKVESSEDLLELLGRRQVLESKCRQIEAQLTQIQSDPAHAAAQKDVAEAQAEVGSLEARIGQLSSYGRSSTQVESEISQLEEGIKAAQAAQGAPAPSVPTAHAAATIPNDAVVAEDPYPKLLASVTDLFQVDLPGLGQLVAPRAAQYLTALSDRRITAVEFGAAGAATLLVGGSRVGWGQLPAPDRDVAYLAIKLTLMEKASEKGKFPLIFDDPFASLEPSRVQLLGRMLKHLGTKAQVFHVSQQAATASSADTQVDLAIA